jgi:hypothetical protein
MVFYGIDSIGNTIGRSSSIESLPKDIFVRVFVLRQAQGAVLKSLMYDLVTYNLWLRRYIIFSFF